MSRQIKPLKPPPGRSVRKTPHDGYGQTGGHRAGTVAHAVPPGPGGVARRRVTLNDRAPGRTITLDRYGHLFPGSEDEAAGLLDAYLERANTAARLAAVA